MHDTTHGQWTMLFRQPDIDDGSFFATHLSGATFREAFIHWAREDLTEWFGHDTDWHTADDEKVIAESLATLSQTKVYPGHLPPSRMASEMLTDPQPSAAIGPVETAQMLARCALAPGAPAPAADTSPFIVSTSHINALVTALDDRDLANGVDADAAGQVLTDANYIAVNAAHGSNEDAPQYTHRCLVVEPWSLLKAADCYRFQVYGALGDAAPAAYGAVGRLRTALLEELGLDEDTYRDRSEWRVADGWPLVQTRPRREVRAQALIERYQDLYGIEVLDPSEWGQHVSDMIADLLHYASTDQNMEPWARLDLGVQHFIEETDEQRPEPANQPESGTTTLRLLVATADGQGQQVYDFCDTIDGEIVYPGPCDLPQPNHACGCLESLVGVDTGRRTTTFTVAEVAITRAELHRVLAKAQNLGEDDPGYADIPELAADMLAVAACFPIGAVLGRSHRRYRRRHTSAPPSDPPTAGPDVPDGEEELKPWTVRVRLRRDHEFTVEARDEDSAMDAAWDAFDEGRNIVGQDSDVHVSLAA